MLPEFESQLFPLKTEIEGALWGSSQITQLQKESHEK